MGDKEKAFELLDKSFADTDPTLIWIGVEPSFDFLRDDERYVALLEKMNHPLAEKTVAKSVQPKNKYFSESPTQIIEKEPAKSIGAMFFIKIFLAIIFLIALGYGAYYFFSHLTFKP